MRLGNNIRNHDQLAAVTDSQHHQPSFPTSIFDTYSGTPYSLPGWAFGGHTTNAVIADRLFLLPFYMQGTNTVTRVSMEITSGGGAGTVLRMGIFGLSIDVKGKMVTDSIVLDAGTVDANSVAVHNITISQELTEGWYGAVFQSDGTPTIRTFEESAVISSPVTMIAEAFGVAEEAVWFDVVSDGAAGLILPSAWNSLTVIDDFGMWFRVG